mgnify:CR=1 FL=1
MQEGVRASLISKCADNLVRALSLFERANGVELTLKEIANVVAILMIKEFEQRVVPEDERERVLSIWITYKEEEAGAWEVSREARINP